MNSIRQVSIMRVSGQGKTVHKMRFHIFTAMKNLPDYDTVL
jgi:hypothetical protein